MTDFDLAALLSRDDVVEAAARAHWEAATPGWSWGGVKPDERDVFRKHMRAALAAVLEMAAALPAEPNATPEEIYRLLARDRAVRWGYDKTLDPADYHRLIEEYVANPNLRADADAIWNAARGGAR